MDDLDQNPELEKYMKRMTNTYESLDIPSSSVLPVSYLINKTMTDKSSKNVVRSLVGPFLRGIRICTSYSMKKHIILKKQGTGTDQGE